MTFIEVISERVGLPVGDVRAVIAAIRDPSQAMAEAVNALDYFSRSDIWETMIDTALNEKSV